VAAYDTNELMADHEAIKQQNEQKQQEQQQQPQQPAEKKHHHFWSNWKRHVDGLEGRGLAFDELSELD
jgi:hypothetical protein